MDGTSRACATACCRAAESNFTRWVRGPERLFQGTSVPQRSGTRVRLLFVAPEGSKDVFDATHSSVWPLKLLVE